MRTLGLVVALLLLAPSARADGWFAEDDAASGPGGRTADEELLDRHLALYVASNGAAGTFGTVSLGLGIERFANREIFPGLTFCLWGAATLVSSATSTESAFRQWSGVRPALRTASEAELRLFRVREADRLTRLAINRAIGLAADGASLGIGVALLIAPSPQGSVARELATSLVLNGAFLLAVDAFRTGLDDQVARTWRARNLESDRGWFGARAARRRGIAAASPWVAPAWGGVALGVSGRM